MAYEHVTLTLPGLRADSTSGLASSQFKIGKLASTAGQVVLCPALTSTVAATTIAGVIMNAPGKNEEVEFAVGGVAKVKIASTDVSIGDWLSCNSTSQALKTTGNAQGVIGRALEAATGTNDIISVLLITGNVRF